MKKSTKHWMAVYTRPRSEKKVAERLESACVEIYCPLQTTIRQWSDRRKKVKIPVFPSYVFVKVCEEERKIVLQDPGVMNFVFWLGKPAIIKEEEIDFIREFLNSGNVIGAHLEAFSKGDPVDIIAGPFSGRKGVVGEINKADISILIESMGLVIKVNMKPQNLHSI